MFLVGAELWRFRALIQALVQRHIATRYRGSLLGFLWSFLNPLCLMGVYTLVFSYYMRFDGGKHYHLLVFAGLLPWIWTSSALSEGTSALVSSGHLITKSMFPAHILPFVSVTSAMIHFVLALPMLIIFMLSAGMAIPATWFLVPVFILLQFIILNGAVLALSALNVFYRDVQHLVGNMLTFLFFLCPVVYPASAVPARFRFLLDANPFAVLTECYQKILIDGVVPGGLAFVSLILVAALSMGIGLCVHSYFRERFAEAL